MIVVTQLFPVAGIVVRDERDFPQPLCTLPGIKQWDHQSRGTAVIGSNRFTVVRVGDEDVWLEEVRKGKIGSPAVIVSGRHDVLGFRLEDGLLEQLVY